MKKLQYLPFVIVAVFLLLCACAQNVTDQPETLPSSSVQLQSQPTTKPTAAPTTIPTTLPTTAPTQPTTKPTTAPTQPTTKPTQPTTPPPTTQPNLEWLTNREIIPFEDRFAKDVPFGYNLRINHSSWLLPSTYPGYPDH